jgi:hypothetical protein
MDLIVQDILRTIHRMKEREHFEMSKRKLLLEKASRSDIISGEASLSEMEKSKLEELNLIVTKFNVQLSRLDEILMIFRDY